MAAVTVRACACGLWPVACGLLPAACCLLPAAWTHARLDLLPATCCLLPGPVCASACCGTGFSPNSIDLNSLDTATLCHGRKGL